MYIVFRSLIFLLLSLSLLINSSCMKLGWINYYELSEVLVIKLDQDKPETRYQIPASEDVSIMLSFQAYGEKMDIYLHQQKMVDKTATFIVLGGLDSQNERPLHAYGYFQGFLKGDLDSRVYGKLDRGGNFHGVLNHHRHSHIYFIEPGSQYSLSNTSHIIYRYSDINQEKFSSPNVAKGKVSPVDRVVFPDLKTHAGSRSSRSIVEHQSLPSMHCPLHLFADHRFFEMIGHGSIAETIDEMLYHIGQADTIFRSSSFDGRGRSNNIGFIIAKITIFKTAEANPMSSIGDHVDAQDYLMKFSMIDHSKYCLGVGFTTNDFLDGVLGLAWIASPNGLETGICASPFVFRNGTHMYFNSGVISFMNYQKLIPRTMFSITVAHELGHNFGAEHDDPDSYTCSPGGTDGNYLMFHVSGDGLKPNHFLFSSCSINYMYRVLLTRMSLCFQQKYTGYCSNAIVDLDSEECDCGTQSTCADLDSCCNVYQQGSNSSLQCTLKSTSKCSPVVSRCCSAETCDFVPESENRLCHSSSECKQTSFCNGLSADCPQPENVPDGAPCRDNLKVCKGGVCAETVCRYNSYFDCYCTSADEDCLICCQHNITGVCKPAIDWGLLAEGQGATPANGLCMDGRGICDSKGYCIRLDGTVAKADITSLVKYSANKVLDFITNYWYAMMIGLIALLALIIIFVYIHKRGKPLQSMAYKDGRMAYVWFEARAKLSQIESELAELRNQGPDQLLPYPIANQRLAYQFPTCPPSVLSRLVMCCNNEQEAVKLIVLSGYPMRRLIQD